MRFEDERYTRVYNRKTNTIKKIGWEGRTVWRELLLELDRAGIFYLGGDTPVDAVSTVCEIPEEITAIGLERLIQRGCLIHIHERDCLFAPRFMEAQEAIQSNSLRQKIKRDRAKARLTLAELSGDPRVAAAMKLVDDDDESGVNARDTPRVANSSSHTTSTHLSNGSPKTPDVSGTTPDVSGATQFDNLKPSRPSLAKPSLDQAAPEQTVCQDSPIRNEHPDGNFDSRDDIPLAFYKPSPWLIDQATMKGLTNTEIDQTLARYRQKSTQLTGHQSSHDKAFAAFLETTRKDKLNRGPNGQRRRQHAAGGGTPAGYPGDKPQAPGGAHRAHTGARSGSRQLSEIDVAHRRYSDDLLEKVCGDGSK